LANDLGLAAWQTAFDIVFLADRAWRAADAIGRTLVRMFVTHRRLLEWTTAAQSIAMRRPDLASVYLQSLGGLGIGLAMAGIAAVVAPENWPVFAPLCLLWMLAPAATLWVSRSPPAAGAHALTDQESRALRLIARRTWRYFETHVTEVDNHLPPDNFQETPNPAVAHRTSPTNIGLYMLSAVVARDFGWAGTTQTVERLEATFATLARLARFNGHFFNWYATLDLRVLDPPYVSTVDSGNLAGHLICLANACEGWMDEPIAPNARRGMGDAMQLAMEALPEPRGLLGGRIADLLVQIQLAFDGASESEPLSPTLVRLAQKAAGLARDLLPAAPDQGARDLVHWTQALADGIAEHLRDEPGPGLSDRLTRLARAARSTALAMDFSFLLDPDRRLLSIGFNSDENRLDASCYDLLASEARLASLFAIAKGDAPTSHWFRLGRLPTPVAGGSILISWSGSMFEYLMPPLVMRAPMGSLLDETDRRVVARQQAFARSKGAPWGISESAYNARDAEFTYQYSNFGVPGLGLKRGLADNLVVAPYATGLAAMVDARGAKANFDRLRAMGALGSYGFYEALDFTPSRVRAQQTFAIVRAYMAHHQGMTIVAIANALDQGRMRDRFHREPIIQATELLLSERTPRDIAASPPRAEEPNPVAAGASETANSMRRLKPSRIGAPVTHLLSNGRYSVMLTASGAGYSRWRDVAITRWRGDATRDDQGAFIILRDTASGALWSAGAQPIDGEIDDDSVVFAEDHARFTRRSGGLTTMTDVIVSSEDDCEVRRVSLANRGRKPREIELTSYAEIVLTAAAADTAHPAFAKLFVHTEYLADFDAVIATRRARSPRDPIIWAAHFAVVEGEVTAPSEHETDRARFLGRGRGLGQCAALTDGGPLSGTVGMVLDPIFSVRRRLLVGPGEVGRVAFWTLVAGSREDLMVLIDKHHDRSAFDRARTLAWTQAQVQLRYMDVQPQEAADFQRLAAAMLYPDPNFRAPSDAIARGAGPQSGLWPLAISGDLPIILLRIDDIEDMAQVDQLLRAHEYWRLKKLDVDLVIVNERASSYVQDLQIAIETAVRTRTSRRHGDGAVGLGRIYALRADLMSLESRALLRSVARVALIASRGPIADQLARAPEPRPLTGIRSAVRSRLAKLRREAQPAPRAGPAPTPSDLEFFNGLGGFADDGREYVTILRGGQTTPAPWINVVANPEFGFQASVEGSGYTWSRNSRDNQITPWSNDPVADPAGEAIYVRDEISGALWTPTAQPIRDQGVYVARHGFGYSRFEHQAHGVALELTQFVPVGDSIKISRLTLRNLSDQPRRLSVAAYADWVLGTSRAASAPFIITEIDEATGAMLARNPWSLAFGQRVAFADLAGQQTSWTADRREFLGRDGAPSSPAALRAGSPPLSGKTGAGLDPCAVLRRVIELGAGETAEVDWFIGQCDSQEAARALIQRYRVIDLEASLLEVTRQWAGLLGAVRVKTPDRATDIMLNGWLLYQTLACRVWARSAFYQASGAYGFRDQLQDGMALAFANPGETRAHILRAAARQFVQGDVQHWWLPGSGQGIRSSISDDRVWLAFATDTYVTTSGDRAILDEIVPFLEGPPLAAGESDAFFQPMVADEADTLFEHCARGLDQSLDLTGPMGLPLIGGGDWNDGMNRVGEGGRGESVWLGWLLVATLDRFAAYARDRDPVRAERWRLHALQTRAALERDGWDGQWYRRATFDDGDWLGSTRGDACQIDSIAQSWAVLSGAGDPLRAQRAMRSLRERLIRPAEGLALLLTPPFDETSRDPGYIRSYPPGVRENGGQYSHAAMWAVLAFAGLGEGDAAADLFALLNPINHARAPSDVERYKVEPYVVAADVYSVAPHVGRGGWTWYTGAAAWMYRAGVEGILGLRREAGFVRVRPCLPSSWPGYEATITVAGVRHVVEVVRSGGSPSAMLDGSPIDLRDGAARLPLDNVAHRLSLRL
jgi:cyclic beta-1,2-glucan synthetase